MTQSVIVEAIEKKKILNVGYGGVVRKVIPHAYGTDKDGKAKLRGFQLVDVSSGVAPATGWRMFAEASMESVTLSDETFEGPSEGYKREDQNLTTIVAQL